MTEEDNREDCCADDMIDSDLTHLTMDKMAAILAGDNFECIFFNENDFVSRNPIDNKPALIQVMAWRRTGDEPLPELMLIQFTDTYIRH